MLTEEDINEIYNDRSEPEPAPQPEPKPEPESTEQTLHFVTVSIVAPNRYKNKKHSRVRLRFFFLQKRLLLL